ncbi:MAG: TSUP family transporter [Solirubrobacterales bacterium]
MEYVGAALLGFAGGTVGGLLGVGGGILFVPALAIFLDEPQIRAEATSLLAIVPVAFVGAWRQRDYGNVDIGNAIVVGAPAVIGVSAGAALQQRLDERAVALLFALLLLATAVALILR